MLRIKSSHVQWPPVRATPEVWEVAASPLLALAPASSRGRPEQLAACVCVSSEGGAAMADPQTVTDFDEGAGIEALRRFAIEPHLPGARPLNYLPAAVHIASMPDRARDALRELLDQLGIRVEIKDEPELSREFFDGMSAHLAGAGIAAAPARAPKSLIRVKGMTIERIAAFAEAAEIFWKARPWRLFEGDVLWRIDPAPKSRGMKYVSVMGGLGEQFGLGFLSGPAQMFSLGEMAGPADLTASMKSTLWSVTFDDEDNFLETDLELWKKHGLRVSGPGRYPLAIGMNPSSGAIQRPTPENLTVMEVVLRTLGSVTKREIRDRLISREVASFAGPVNVRLQGVVAL
ncbi:MAG: hypothetical protein IT435_06605 [Phycisphaerales bacterium]|nr:hypothetical protein [Phycisphaerales bacterium]